MDSGVLLLRDGYMSSSSHGWTSVDLFLMGGLGVLYIMAWVVCLLMGMGGCFVGA